MITKEDERTFSRVATRIYLERRVDRIRLLLEGATSLRAGADHCAAELLAVYGIKLPPRTAYR